MSNLSPLNISGRNRLLDLLPEAERERLLGSMERGRGKLGDMVCERHEQIAYVDFPISAVISVVVTMEDGDNIEAGVVGNEGMVGLPLFFGVQRSPSRAYYQVPGETMRMSARLFEEEMAARRPLYGLVQRYAQTFLTQVTQAAACNRVHPVEQRLCRWILISHDRVGSDTIMMTQEVMAQMLGVRRASVSVVAAMLQKAGFIRYSRGVMTILDRAGLEASSCECYRVVRSEMERLLG